MARGHTITETVTLVTEDCYSCGLLFAMTSTLSKRATGRQGGPSTARTVTGSTTSARPTPQLRKEAEQAKASAEEEARIARVEAKQAKAEVRRLKNRANAGACPYCNRSFVQLTRHIHSKHPGQAHA